MPYTHPDDRHYELPDPGMTPHQLAGAINTWLRDPRHRFGTRTPGILVWGVCELMNRFAARHDRCFDTWFDVLHGLQIADMFIMHNPEERTVLDCARLEFYRRVVAPYENLARQRNGEVWDESILPLDGSRS